MSDEVKSALEKFRAALWDSLYGQGITKEYAQAVDKEIDEAIAAWNRRAPDPALSVLREALNRIIIMCDGPVQQDGSQKLDPFELGGAVSSVARAALQAIEGEGK